jgi:hypothetical protein
MNARWTLAVLIVTTGTSGAQAQAPWQFRWNKGEVLTYRVKHETMVTEVVDGGKHQFKSQLNLLKRYRITDVDTHGTVTIEVSLAAMRNEQTRPNGEVLLFDSADVAKSTPELREQLAKYVGTTLAVLQIDAAGRVVAVKQGQTARYLAEPPFTLVLPGVPLQEGQPWVRNFDITLEPPLGTGEKHAAQQEFRCTKLAGGQATIALKTGFKNLPETVQERMPLVQKESQGEVVFDIAAGRVAAVRLTIDRTLENHQGPGSSYRFQSVYAEEYVVK